ncbi:hypothetical protein ACEPAF_7751 [Sanghuangporus sanghuang]
MSSSSSATASSTSSAVASASSSAASSVSVGGNLKGIHMQSNNLASLHTTEGRSMPASTACTKGANEDADCQTIIHGWGIAMYFWNRYDSNVPPEVKYGSDSVTPKDYWGEPQALFPTDNCDLNYRFASHNIIMNLSF